MNPQLIVILAGCLSMLSAPASSTSLVAASAAVKGAIIGAGLTALTTSGGSHSVVVQAGAGASPQVVAGDQVLVHDPVYSPAKPIYTIPQTVSYSYSSSPLSRLWGAISSAISAKTRAIGQLFGSGSNQVIIVQVPEKSTTEKSTTTSTTTTTKKPHHEKPSIVIDFEAAYNKPANARVQPISVVQYLKKK